MLQALEPRLIPVKLIIKTSSCRLKEILLVLSLMRITLMIENKGEKQLW